MKKVIPLDPKKQLITPKKRVAAYARVSIDTDPMMHSVEAQISYYSALIQSNPDWIYAGVYADKGISGTGVKNRRSFQEMMEACEKGEIDIILCKSISRFARNTVDLLESVRRLKELGVDVQFERERISSLSKEGEFMLSVLASFAQEESRSISENCKWGIRKAYASGNPHKNNERIFGYRYDKEQKQYVIVPEEAEIVREIFRLYLDGMSTDKIAKKLNAEGKRTSTGAIFRVSRINVILDYEFYTGDRLLQKHYLDGHLTKKQKKNNGELPQYLYTDDHEAIIDRETFSRVQEERKRRRAFFQNTVLGYRLEGDRYVIDPQNAEIVRLVFKMYLDRMEYAAIARTLNAQGYQTVRKRAFNINTVIAITKNEFYAPDNPRVSEPILDTETYTKIVSERAFRAAHKYGRNLQNNFLGYRKVDGKYVLDPEWAEIIRLIFRMYVQREKLNDIAATLNGKGYKTEKGRIFKFETVSAIVLSDLYDPHLPDVAEPLLDDETYEKVKAERAYREEHKYERNLQRNILGYLKKDGKYVLDPQWAEIIRMIFRMYLAREQISDIVTAVNELGCKTAAGKPFSHYTVSSIVQSKLYDPALPDIAEPLLDPETYEKVKIEREFREEHKYRRCLN